MSEEILGRDEVERIAKEYVRHKENVSDIEVTGTEWSSIGGLLVCLVQGEARKHSVDKTTWQGGVVAECPFSLQVSAKDRNVISYRRTSGWVKKNAEQAPPGYQIPVEPVEFISSPGESFGARYGMDNFYDLRKKEAEIKRVKAEEDLLKEIQKDIRDRRRRR